jgi:hypothetical protein
MAIKIKRKKNYFESPPQNEWQYLPKWNGGDTTAF